MNKNDKVVVISPKDKHYNETGEVIQVSNPTVWVRFAGNCVSTYLIKQLRILV